MKVVALYVGSSLLAPLKQAERELNRQYELELSISAYNFGSPLANDEWAVVEDALRSADVIFAIHVMDGENAARLISALDHLKQRQPTVVVINCMPELMRHTRMGKLDVSKLLRR